MPPLILRLFLLVALFAGMLLLNLCLGEVQLSPAELFSALQSNFASQALPVSAEQQILLDIRLPRALAAALVGLALAVSGYLLQSLSHNGLADPYLTGVSSGAGLAVAASIMLGLNFNFVPLVSLGGGLMAALLVVSLSKSSDGISITRLLLSGVALSAFCGAIVTMLVASGHGGSRAQSIYYWLAGSVSGTSWSQLCCASIYIAAALFLAFAASKPLRLLSLGASSARSLGLDAGRFQLAILLAAVLLCSAAVSLAGVVGFAGLIAPYFARMLFGRDERMHILGSALFGATLVLASDLAARSLSSAHEPPLGTLLSLIGGPFFVYLLLKREEGESRL